MQPLVVIGLLGPLAFSRLCVAAVPLPPVVVPLPREAPAPESPLRRDPTASIVVIDAREREGEAKDAADLLGTAASVLVEDHGGVGQAKTVSIRGASPNAVLVLLDGIPLSGAGGVSDLALLPLATLDHLEVLRGGAGARYGSGGLGGAVNAVTRSLTEAPHAEGRATYGSYGTATGELGASGAVGPLDGLLWVHGPRSDGDFSYPFNPTPQLGTQNVVTQARQNNQAAEGGALFKLRAHPWRATTVDALADFALVDRGLAGTAQNPSATAHELSQRVLASARVTRELDQGELSARLFAKRDDTQLLNLEAEGRVDQHFTTAGLDLAASRLVAERHGLSGLVQLGSEALSSVQSPNWFSFAAMASDEVSLLSGHLTVIPSMRVDVAGPFAGVSPKLGVSVTLPAGFELKANGGQSFRNPSFLELYVQQGHLLPNPSLRPERGLSADAALCWTRGSTRLSLGGFEALYEDLISYEYYPPLLARPFNFSSAQVAGLEVEVEAKPRPWLSTAASYAFTRSWNLRDDPRYYLKDLPFRPRHRVAGRVTAGPRVAQARAELVYQSEQFFNRTGTLSLPDRALLSVGLSSQLWDRPAVVASIELKNLLDAQTQDFDGYPLPGRALYLTVRVAWDAQTGSLSSRSDLPSKKETL